MYVYDDFCSLTKQRLLEGGRRGRTDVASLTSLNEEKTLQYPNDMVIHTMNMSVKGSTYEISV